MIPQKHRLCLNFEKEKLKKSGQKLSGQFVALVFRRHSPARISQVATLVSKKISPKATARNRLRRRLQAIIRPFIIKKKGYKILLLPHQRALNTPFEKLKQDLESLLYQLK